MEKEIFVVIVLLVFGGVDCVETFTDENEANEYIVEWANDNCPEHIYFETANEALEWFKNNDSLVDYTIQLYTSSIKIEEVCGDVSCQ